MVDLWKEWRVYGLVLLKIALIIFELFTIFIADFHTVFNNSPSPVVMTSFISFMEHESPIHPTVPLAPGEEGEEV